MSMTVLLDQSIFVSYSQAWVYSGESLFDGDHDVDKVFEGQVNGLCGAAEPGVLELITGTHTGDIPFRIELHTSEPPLAEEWEEVVDVSFSPTDDVGFAGLDSEDQYPLDLPRGSYRVRYCVRGMEEADTADEPTDAYLLQFWPAAPAPDRIVRRTSRRAAYWHRAHRPLTPEEQAEQDQQEAEKRATAERERYGDRVPNERLRAVQGLYATLLARLDIELTFALSEADDATHRAVAAWAAVRALEQAGLIDLPAIAPAVTALRRGRPAPPPFDDSGTAWSILANAPVARTSVPVPPPQGDYEQSPQDWAITTLFHSAEPDSLTAVLDILVALAFVYGRDGYRQVLAEVREKFPQLAG
jgi:hypothetical protein